jgi:hypothetical protein
MGNTGFEEFRGVQSTFAGTAGWPSGAMGRALRTLPMAWSQAARSVGEASAA